MPPPGAGTPDGGQDPSVAAGSQPGGAPQAPPGSGILPPNGSAVPQSAKALGKDAVATDVIRAALNAMKHAFADLIDPEFQNSVMEAIQKIQKHVKSADPKDHQTGGAQKIQEAILARKMGGAQGQGAGGAPPPPAGRPPGMPQMQMPGAGPDMQAPPGE